MLSLSWININTWLLKKVSEVLLKAFPKSKSFSCVSVIYVMILRAKPILVLDKSFFIRLSNVAFKAQRYANDLGLLYVVRQKPNLSTYLNINLHKVSVIPLTNWRKLSLMAPEVYNNIIVLKSIRPLALIFLSISFHIFHFFLSLPFLFFASSLPYNTFFKILCSDILDSDVTLDHLALLAQILVIFLLSYTYKSITSLFVRLLHSSSALSDFFFFAIVQVLAA